MEIIDKRFSIFARTLRKYDTHVNSAAAFVRKLFDKSVDEYNSSIKKLPKWAKENESFNPFHGLTNDMLTRFYNGNRNLSHDLCRKIVPFLNMDNFKCYFDTLNATDEIEQELKNSIKQFNLVVESDEINEIYASYFISLMNQIASEETHKRGPKPIPAISPFCSADTETDFENRIIAAIENLAENSDKDFDDNTINPPYTLSEKIKDKRLCMELEIEVMYFPRINSILADAENKSGKPSEYILSTVHRHFVRVNNQNISEREIVKRMQQFFAVKAGIDADSFECKILTVYFIQLCEVFYGASR